MNINGGKASTIERGGHFDLAVDALFTQDGDTRTVAIGDEASSNIVIEFKAEQRLQTGVGIIGDGFKLLISAVCVVTQALDLPAGFCPDALPGGAGVFQNRFTGQLEDNGRIAGWLTDHGAALLQPSIGELAEHVGGIFLRYLDDGAEFFAEQHSGQCLAVLGEHIEVDAQAATGGKRHFCQRGEEATVRAVMIGKQQLILVQPLNDGEEGFQVFGIVQIRHLLTDLVVYLRQSGAAHTVLATPQVDCDQVCRAMIQTQLRRQGGAYVLHWRKAGDDQ